MILELCIAFSAGICLSVCGLAPLSLILLVVPSSAYKTWLSALLVANLLPVSIGATYEYWLHGTLDWKLGLMVFLCTAFGALVGTIALKKLAFSLRTIKLITSAFGFIIGIAFACSAMNII